MQFTVRKIVALAVAAALWGIGAGATEARAAQAAASDRPAPVAPAAAPAGAAPDGAPAAVDGGAAAPTEPWPAGAREWSYALGDARELVVESTAGSVRIVAGADDRVHVRGRHRDRDAALDVHYVVRRGVGTLEVRGDDSLQVVVAVPRAPALEVRMSAGELEIGPRDGDLDVRLRAGEIRIDALDAAQYADVDVSVLTGDIEWAAANVRREGLFRSYDAGGGGRARLRVRLLAGSVVLE